MWHSRGSHLSEHEGECGCYNFPVKTDSVMHDLKVSPEKECLAFFQFATNTDGVSSSKLARDIGISQPSEWHLGHSVWQVLNCE